MSEANDRGSASTALWEATCKDCRAERRASADTSRSVNQKGHVKTSQAPPTAKSTFEYSNEWAERMLDRGNTRSDRCERHRKAHRVAIQALAVPYTTLSVIGEVADPEHPSGPLGGLGPLPVLHQKISVAVQLDGFEFGMTDQDILQILDGLREKQVAVIEAGTGTGKSTFMPFRLMNPPEGASFRLSKAGPIVVTEPRRAAAVDVSRFVGEELCFKHDSRTCSSHIGPGFAVGYQVKGEKHWDGACELIYVTDGTMINWVRDGQLSRIGVVIIDEAHERSENIDIILAQLREKIDAYKHLRVIITSATLDKNFFVEYFGGPERVFHLSVPAKKTFGYGVPFFVDTQIDDDIVANGLTIGSEGSGNLAHFDGWSKVGPEQDGYPAEDLQKATLQLQALRCVDAVHLKDWKEKMPSAVAKQVVAIAEHTEWGDILAFLPTTATIDDAIQKINEQLASKRLISKFDVYPLLSTTEKTISEKATAARSRGQKRKIVVSSNLAETSLTVKGVRYIVDSGLICQSEWDPQLASGSYPTKPHSQSGVRQRWGRVGRDAPGWVFPLYTVEDFLSLPRNTPPGSAQTNLETFYMKLMAAGLDLEESVLPANFRHENVSYDEDALQIMSTFDEESERARSALRLAGAVDHDGHLTEYGRELERFPGTGSEALALMLAEQLACIHEVALALKVLGQGELFGKKDNCILQIDKSWPSAWRVVASQRHQGLVIGCCDDLDIVLRICALWQSADNSSDWCKSWWVNERALDSAWAATMETVKSLSAAMKGEAFRRIEPALAGRARAVLTRAMVSLKYRRLDGAQFSGRIGVSEEAVTAFLSDAQLVETGDHILAFSRYRLSSKRIDEAGKAAISHAVRVVEWAEGSDSGSDNMGLDLIMRAAEHAGEQSDSSASVADVMSAVRTQLPIGTRIHMELEREQSGAMRILRNEVSHAPFQRPVEQRSDRERGEDTSSGFDSEWDPRGANVEAELSEEEVALQVVDPRETESNGRPIRESDQSRAVNDSIGPLEPLASLPTLYAQAAWESEPLSPETWGRIVGYEVIDASNIALVIEPLDVRAPVDPGDHPDLAYGQEIEVRVCGVVKNTESGFVQIARMDGLGYFYLRVPPWNELKPGERGDLNGTTIGLINTDGDCLSRLMPGSVFTGVVITNETDGVTITLLPALYADLAHTTSEILPVDGTPTAFYAARIIEAANPWGKVRIELEYGQPKKGLSHQFEIEKQLLGRARISQQEIGCQLLVALNRDRGRSRNTLKIDGQNRKLITFVKACGDNLRLNGDKIEMGDGDLSLAVIQGLQACDSSSQWRNGVWEFYTASLRYSVGAIRPQITRTYVTCSPHIVSLLQQRRLDIQDRYEAVMRPTEAAGTIEIASPQAAAAEEGARGLKELSDLPRIIAILPPNTAGLVLGKEHVHRKVLETRPGIHWVWVDNDTLGIIGEIDQAVERALEVVRTMVEGTTGELIVPAGKNGLLIGRNGATIQRLKDSTGCQARNLNRGEKWIVDGPTEAAVRAFFQMANQIVGGTGKIVNSRKLRIIENTTKGASARPQRASQVVGRNMESSYSPPTGVPSTPRTTERKDASRCFIATACYGTSTHPDVILLRRWRDTNLLRSFTGQLFVRLYYCFSPTVAKFLTKRKTIARIVRVLVLQRMVRHLRPRL